MIANGSQLNEVAYSTTKLNLKNEIMSNVKTSLENETTPSCLGAVMHWVAIDKPPKKDGRYLVYIEEVDLIMIGEWKEDCFHGGGMLPICTVVSHWQPLPKPPCA